MTLSWQMNPSNSITARTDNNILPVNARVHLRSVLNDRHKSNPWGTGVARQHQPKHMKRAPETAKHSLEISALSAQRKNIWICSYQCPLHIITSLACHLWYHALCPGDQPSDHTSSGSLEHFHLHFAGSCWTFSLALWSLVALAFSF